MTRDFNMPLRVVSEANQREHWATKAKRVKRQRAALLVYWRADGLPEGRKPVKVRLTRWAPRALDSDNLAGAFKAVRDEIAALCGFDDRAADVEWVYRQEPSREYRVSVEVEWP